MARIGFDPTTYNKSSAEYTMGQYLDYNGKMYRYIKALEALTAGIPCEWGDTTYGVYKAAHASSTGRRCAGVSVGSITLNYYGFIQTNGIVSVTTDGNVVKGDFLKTGTAVALRDTSTLSIDFGYALADDSSTTLASCLLLNL